MSLAETNAHAFFTLLREVRQLLSGLACPCLQSLNGGSAYELN
jgi:hypothetical protein